MKNTGYIRQKRGIGGFTLVEMLVAVGITIGMILATGVVFRSATEAAGKSMAMNDILQQLRAVTRQLETDFSGLRPDMPLAIIFERDTVGVDTDDDGIWDFYPRQDRIVFFANGNFQVSDGVETDYSNMAYIYYGQMSDRLEPGGDPDVASPMRRILARRYKIITPAAETSWPSPGNAEQADYDPIDTGTMSYWQNVEFDDYINNPTQVTGYFMDDPAAKFSLIRRPEKFMIDVAMDNGDIRRDGLQNLYLLGDVTDFKVEVWFESTEEWFPSDETLAYLDGLLLTPIIPPFGFYWNVNEADLVPTMIDDVQWRSDLEVKAAVETDPSVSEFDPWPQALRFTFTLYDKGRNRYPQGQTFSYIVKIGARR